MTRYYTILQNETFLHCNFRFCEIRKKIDGNHEKRVALKSNNGT